MMDDKECKETNVRKQEKIKNKVKQESDRQLSSERGIKE